MAHLPYDKVKLDPKQRRLWEDTLAALSWIAPGFVHILYTMLAKTGDGEVAFFTEQIASDAGTDGLQVLLKPSGFFSRNLMKRVFMVLHEVMHVVLDHCTTGVYYRKTGKVTLAGRELPYNALFANIVQDLIINAILIQSKFGEFDKAWLFDKALNAHERDWVTLYFDLWKANPPPKPKPGQGQPGKGEAGPSYPVPGNRFDEHLEPGEPEGKEAHEVPQRNQAAWDIAINTAMEIQRAHGKLPGAMEHFFKDLLKPKVDWTDHVRGELTRISGSGAYSWEKIDRRMAVRGIGCPSVTGHSCGLLVVGFDSSGSIFRDKTLLDRFRGEMAGMLEDLNPEALLVLVCDTRITQELELHDPDDLRRTNVIKGGGGTSFIPVFDYIDEHDLRPDALIYLTDGYGSFPKHEPDYPVIWGDISGDPKLYKFGKHVYIPTSKD